MTIAQNAIGAAFDTVFTPGDAINQYPPFELGTIMWDVGKAYIFVQANGAITANDVVLLTEAYQADQIDTTNSASAFGDAVAVAGVTFADDDYGWVQIYGPCTVNVATGAAVNTALNTTGTSGRIDDDATSGAEVVDRIVTTAAESGNEAAAFISWPTVGATL